MPNNKQLGRELKFRAWDKKTKIMLDDVDQFSLAEIAQSLWVWQQFTGLLDKNGKEIYEGDLVDAYYPTDDKRITGEVAYDMEQFIGYRIGNTRMSACTDFKVKGNVYENQ